MDDQELLEKAARAAGVKLAVISPFVHRHGEGAMLRDGSIWNPLENDGDAFRMMHEARLDLHHGENEYGEGIITVVGEATCWADSSVCEEHDIAGLRRAIVRAAAMMGEE